MLTLLYWRPGHVNRIEVARNEPAHVCWSIDRMNSLHIWDTSRVFDRIRSRLVRVRPCHLAFWRIGRIYHFRWATLWTLCAIAARQLNAWCVYNSMPGCSRFSRCHRMTIRCHSHADRPAFVSVPFQLLWFVCSLLTSTACKIWKGKELTQRCWIVFAQKEFFRWEFRLFFSLVSNLRGDPNPTFRPHTYCCATELNAPLSKCSAELKVYKNKTEKQRQQRSRNNVDQ